MPMRAILALCCWLSLIWAGGAVAAAPPGARTPGADFKVADLDQTIRFTPTSVTTSARIEREALSVEGARIVGTFSLLVNLELETLEVLDAYTAKADGTRIPVPPEGQWTQRHLEPDESAGHNWPKTEVRRIQFVDVAPGDRTVLRLRRHQHTAALPGWFSLSEILPASVEFDRFHARIEAPPDLPLHVVAPGMTLKHGQAAGGAQVWTATASTRRPWPHHLAGIVPPAPAPRLLVSTYASHGVLAQAYADLSRPMARVTPAVAALARDITSDQAPGLAQARAIHDWVRTNVRYDAVYLGVGSWIPREADAILRTRFGDCKDQVLLTQALLAAVGIEAVPALLHTNDEYRLPELPVAFSFNHVILYLPQWQLFLDPTAAQVPFGALPWAAAGKPVAVALAEGGRILHTPAFRAEENQLTTSTVLTLRPDGSAHAVSRVTALGHSATRLRDYLARIPAGMEAFVVPGLLRLRGLQGTGTLHHRAAPTDRLAQELTLEADIRPPQNALENRPLALGPVVPLPFSILLQMGDHAAASRPGDSVCAPMTVREDFELHLPPALQVSRHPANLVKTHPDGIRFEAHYSKRDHVFHGRRELTLSQPRHVCSSADYASRRPTMERIARHLEEKLLLGTPASSTAAWPAGLAAWAAAVPAQRSGRR